MSTAPMRRPGSICAATSARPDGTFPPSSTTRVTPPRSPPAIQARATKPEGRLKLRGLVTSMAREAGGLTDSQARHFGELRDHTPAETMNLE